MDDVFFLFLFKLQNHHPPLILRLCSSISFLITFQIGFLYQKTSPQTMARYYFQKYTANKIKNQTCEYY